MFRAGETAKLESGFRRLERTSCQPVENLRFAEDDTHGTVCRVSLVRSVRNARQSFFRACAMMTAWLCSGSRAPNRGVGVPCSFSGFFNSVRCCVLYFVSACYFFSKVRDCIASGGKDVGGASLG